jgi:hypothetical protein
MLSCLLFEPAGGFWSSVNWFPLDRSDRRRMRWRVDDIELPLAYRVVTDLVS